jgi:hypothetical protein
LASVEESIRHFCFNPVIAREAFHAIVAAGDLGESFNAATRLAATAIKDFMLQFRAGKVLNKIITREVEVVAKSVAGHRGCG